MSKEVTLNSSGLVGLRGRMCFSVWVGEWEVGRYGLIGEFNLKVNVSVEEESSGLSTVQGC